MLRRHDLLKVDSLAWAAMLARRSDLRALPLLETWASCGYPVIVRRAAACDSPGELPVALPLPPGNGKLRIALSLPADAKVKKMQPVLLCGVAVPSSWQQTVTDLLTLGERLGTIPRVFGSLLWQSLTGLSYLTDQSDLDLLWQLSDEHEAASLVEQLSTIAATSPVRIDGELLLPDGAGVHWKEAASSFHRTQPEVLVKTMEGVFMRSLTL